VEVPSSKSYTIRAALCAAMAEGDSFIGRPLDSDDGSAVLECIEQLGARVEQGQGGIVVHGGTLRAPRAPLWCRESGATFRFLAAIAATLDGITVLKCAPSLARRPVEPLLQALRQTGATLDFDAAAGELAVTGQTLSSAMVTLPGDVSSQFLSALLLSGPMYSGGLVVAVSTRLVSERYVAMTVDCMRQFGARVDKTPADGRFHVTGSYAPSHYVVEGDWSSAAAVLTLGALAGQASIDALRLDSLQADVAILALLGSAGARIVAEDGNVTVSGASLHAFVAELGEAIDLLPVACVLAAAADGVTTLTGISRAREKESDRVLAMAEGLSQLGIRVEVERDLMRIWGGGGRSGTVSSAGDHRIAMAFGILGARVGAVTIEAAESVSKTYPGFWDTLASLGVEVALYE